MYYVYLIKSGANGEVYIGSTNNLKRRFSDHNKGLVQSTKRYKSWRLVYYEAYSSEKDAREREMKLKQHGNSKRQLKQRITGSLKNGAGFTLIEMLVVVVIIGVLTTMVLANYNSGKKQLALQRAANKLAQDIRRVQEMAMANTYMAGCFQGGSPHWQNYKYGFGIEVDTSDRNKYTIFADCKSDNQYKQQDEDVLMELPDFNAVEIDSVNSTTGRLDIVFSPPDPSDVFQLGGSDVNQASIKIRIKGDATKTKTITVNKVGLIEIQ